MLFFSLCLEVLLPKKTLYLLLGEGGREGSHTPPSHRLTAPLISSGYLSPSLNGNRKTYFITI